MQSPIYLDYNATTPLFPEVVEAMLPYLREHFGNPSSGHALGRRAKEGVERARAQVAAAVGARPEEIVFTSGGTEANNLAIRGVTEAWQGSYHLVTSVIEHPATAKPAAFLEARGVKVSRVGVDEQGVVRLADVEAALAEGAHLVSIMHANNETGVLQPIGKIAEMAKKKGILLHTDAAQSLGKVALSVDALGVDLLSIAGHKLYAPKGVGALYVRHGTPLAPFALGAGHERGLRPGTENVASIVGLGLAAEMVSDKLAQASQHMGRLRDRLEGKLKEAVPGLVVHGEGAARLCNTAHVRFPGVSGSALLAGAPEVLASTGSACHEGHETASGVVLAMGVSPTDALGSVRLTLGRTTGEDEVDRAAEALIQAFRDLAMG